MRGEGYAFLLNLTEFCKRENLKPTAVGKYRAVPTGEFMYTAEFLYEFVSGSYVKMVCIAKLHLCSDVSEIIGIKCTFYRTAGRDVLKGGSFDSTVYCRKFT